MPTLLCAADGEGQGQLSPVPGVKGKGSIFPHPCHHMAWRWGLVLLSCPPGLSLVPRQQVSSIALSRQGAEPDLPCAAAGGDRASSPTGHRQRVAEEEWSQIS